MSNVNIQGKAKTPLHPPFRRPWLDIISTSKTQTMHWAVHA